MSNDVQIKEVPAVLVASIRLRASIATVGKEIQEAFARLADVIEPVGFGEGLPGIVTHEKPADGGGDMEVEVVMPILHRLEPPEGVEVRVLEGGSVATAIHRGPYDQVGPTYEALAAWVPLMDTTSADHRGSSISTIPTRSARKPRSPRSSSRSGDAGASQARAQPFRPLEPAPPPPSKTPAPSTKPKLYQLPLLWISYTFTLSLNSEMTNVIGAMMPCHRPSQKPAISPPCTATPSWPFAPGAQLVSVSSRSTATTTSPGHFSFTASS